MNDGYLQQCKQKVLALLEKEKIEKELDREVLRNEWKDRLYTIKKQIPRQIHRFLDFDVIPKDNDIGHPYRIQTSFSGTQTSRIWITIEIPIVISGRSVGCARVLGFSVREEGEPNIEYHIDRAGKPFANPEVALGVAVMKIENGGG